ncbi:DNA/RNA helicase domain-containing protein [Paenibacillus sp. GP183]|uniref:DNA/RNA helicase domain-containing protein n=1 Tax=Paenibacillus sp. GP183 TaxID=1882751 RepID=UPI000B89A61F|nr:DNA/RNA helicase domain-containing protein [Paenibacillus sp. GP183]
MVAGYCWDWKTEGKGNNNVYDISISDHDFFMSWNLNNTTTWAIDPESVEQAGCIHTSQGLEFDYVGVIIGEDLRYENGRIMTDPFNRAKTDKSLTGFKSLYKKNKDEALRIADQIIKNTYRTLMTRGMKGCYVYCMDPDLKKYLIQRMIRKSKLVYIPYSEQPIAAEQSATYYVTNEE